MSLRGRVDYVYTFFRRCKAAFFSMMSQMSQHYVVMC